MKTTKTLGLYGEALSVAACIRYLKCNGWTQPEPGVLVRLNTEKGAK